MIYIVNLNLNFFIQVEGRRTSDVFKAWRIFGSFGCIHEPWKAWLGRLDGSSFGRKVPNGCTLHWRKDSWSTTGGFEWKGKYITKWWLKLWGWASELLKLIGLDWVWYTKRIGFVWPMFCLDYKYMVFGVECWLDQT